MSREEAIQIARLRVDPKHQARESAVDFAHVRVLLDSDPESWPPLKVTPSAAEEGRFDIVGGVHRYHAALEIGLSELRCVILPTATFGDAVEDNLSHGLPLTIPERKRYARWLHDQHPDWSLREVGRKCGLNHETVKASLTAHDDPLPSTQLKTKPELMPRLVDLLVRAFEEDEGRRWAGIGPMDRVHHLKLIVEAYPEEERPQVAIALEMWGTACQQTAQLFVTN